MKNIVSLCLFHFFFSSLNLSIILSCRFIVLFSPCITFYMHDIVFLQIDLSTIRFFFQIQAFSIFFYKQTKKAIVSTLSPNLLETIQMYLVCFISQMICGYCSSWKKSATWKQSSILRRTKQHVGNVKLIQIM